MHRWIRLFTIATVNCLLLCVAAYAQASNLQSSSKEPHGHGYAFFAPGGISDSSTATGHVGVGGEGIFGNGLGIGAEIGYVKPINSRGDGIGLFSLNGAYHFKTPAKSFLL